MCHWSGLRKALLLLGLLTLLTGCLSSDPPTDFVDNLLSGQIAGKTWAYAYAFVDPTIDTPEEDDMVIVILPFKPKGRCPQDTVTGKDKRSIMVSLPLIKKITPLKAGSNRNAVFQNVSKGKRAATAMKMGKVQLDVITKKKIEGRIFAKHNNGNWVSGKFSAEVCEYADFQ